MYKARAFRQKRSRSKPKLIGWVIFFLLLIGVIIFTSDPQKFAAFKDFATFATPATPTITPTATVTPTITPTPFVADWEGLETRILGILGTEQAKWGIYIKDVERDSTLGINEELEYSPASIYKIPLALVLLRDLDAGKITFDTTYLVTSSEKIYTFDALSQRKGNYNISLKDIMNYLIIHSDNTAMTTLERRSGGVTELQKRMLAELESGNFTRIPQQAIAKDIGHVFEGLYNGDYLKQETNDYLLDLMGKTAPNQNKCIVAGTPNDIKIAHKAGNLSNMYGDAGIVYGAKTKYILVMINENINPTAAQLKCEAISKAVYEYLN